MSDILRFSYLSIYENGTEFPATDASYSCSIHTARPVKFKWYTYVMTFHSERVTTRHAVLVLIKNKNMTRPISSYYLYFSQYLLKIQLTSMYYWK
jgi:hypothetical protein